MYEVKKPEGPIVGIALNCKPDSARTGYDIQLIKDTPFDVWRTPAI